MMRPQGVYPSFSGTHVSNGEGGGWEMQGESLEASGCLSETSLGSANVARPLDHKNSQLDISGFCWLISANYLISFYVRSGGSKLLPSHRLSLVFYKEGESDDARTLLKDSCLFSFDLSASQRLIMIVYPNSLVQGYPLHYTYTWEDVSYPGYPYFYNYYNKMAETTEDNLPHSPNSEQVCYFLVKITPILKILFLFNNI